MVVAVQGRIWRKRKRKDYWVVHINENGIPPLPGNLVRIKNDDMMNDETDKTTTVPVFVMREHWPRWSEFMYLYAKVSIEAIDDGQGRLCAHMIDLVECAPDPLAVEIIVKRIIKEESSFYTLQQLKSPPFVESTLDLITVMKSSTRKRHVMLQALVRHLQGAEKSVSHRLPHIKRRHVRLLHCLEQVGQAAAKVATAESRPPWRIYAPIPSNVTTTAISPPEHGPAVWNLPAVDDPTELASRRGPLGRVEYLESRKHPQVQWMIGRIQRMLDSKYQKKLFSIVDVGGGRGDLAVALAQVDRRVHVTVIDANESSLSAGQTYAKAMGVAADQLTFQHADFADYILGTAKLPNKIDMVVALHACGQLSDWALNYAVHCKASFCICPCCYSKRFQVLTDKREGLGEPGWWQYCRAEQQSLLPMSKDKEEDEEEDKAEDEAEDKAEDKEEDKEEDEEEPVGDSFKVEDASMVVGRLAETDERPVTGELARTLINSMRLSEIAMDTGFRISLEAYPESYSKRNQVLVGEYEP